MTDNRSENILEAIREEAREQNAWIGEYLAPEQIETTKEILNLQTLMMQIDERNAQEQKYDREQQGQEVNFSKIQQHKQEQAVEALRAPSGGIASEETAQEQHGKIRELAENTYKSLKATIAQGKENLVKKLEDKAAWGNITGAIKSDTNLVMGKLQLLTSLPGVTTILTVIKATLSAIALFLISKFPKMFMPLITLLSKLPGMSGIKEWAVEGAPKKPKKFEDTDEYASRFGPEGDWENETGADLAKAKDEWEKANLGYWDDTKRIMGNMRDHMKGAWADAGESIKKAKEFWKDRNIHMVSWEAGFRKGFKDFRENMNPKETFGKWAGQAKAFAIRMKKAVAVFLSNVLWVITNPVQAFKAAAKAMWAAVKRFMFAIGQFLIQVALFTVNLLIAIGGFIIANLPIIAIIALIVLVAVGLYFLIKYLSENWELIKAKMGSAIDSIKIWGEKAWNWIKDFGQDIGYKIQWFVAKLKDAFANAFNWMIDKANMIPGVNIEKFEGGNVAAIEKDRQEVLAKRSERDAELAEREKAVKDSNEAKEKAAREKDKERNAPVVTSVNNNVKNQKSTHTRTPQPRDHFMASMNASR